MIAYGLARIGRDVQVRFAPNGDAVASISLAFNYRSKGENATQWVDAALWGKRAESLAPYLKKGNQISVTLGDVCMEKYQGANGEGVKLAARVIEIELVSQKSEPTQNQPAQREPAKEPKASKPAANFDDSDDDIPF